MTNTVVGWIALQHTTIVSLHTATLWEQILFIKMYTVFSMFENSDKTHHLHHYGQLIDTTTYLINYTLSSLIANSNRACLKGDCKKYLSILRS